MKSKIFAIILAALLLVVGYVTYGEFWANHSYYVGMFKSGKNWWLIVSALIAAVIPVLYLIYAKSKKLSKLLLTLFLGLLLFGFVHLSQKGGLVSWGFLIYIINIAILFSLSIGFITLVFSLGTFIQQKLVKFKSNGIAELALTFGMGLGALMLFVHFLVITGLFYGIILWLAVIGLIVLAYSQRKALADIAQRLLALFDAFKRENLKKTHWTTWLMLALLVLTLVYYFYGFHMSYIPYPTAWDANHAYMYYPKIWAAENGMLWENGPSPSPFLWLSYIAFWFGLFKPLSSWFWISPDSIAVNMNFLSGMFVIFFGLGLFKEVITWFSDKITKVKNASSVVFTIGWSMLLLWMTSGMGAFLLFVDNKTDMGILALTILAIWSGFIFLNKIEEHQEKTKKLHKESVLYILISAVFFALAVMSKPTAFIDIANFAVLLAILWGAVLFGLGIAVFLIAIVGKLQILNAGAFIKKGAGTIPAILGLVLSAVTPIKMFLNKQVKYLKYLALWAGATVGILLLLKSPHVLYKTAVNGWESPSRLMKSYLMGYDAQENKDANAEYESKKLFASTDVATVVTAVSADVQAVPSAKYCSLERMGVSADELYASIEKPEGTGISEDVGRYVGFGQKKFAKPLWGSLLPQGCLGAGEAALLCENQDAINNIDTQVLNDIAQELHQDETAYTLVSSLVDAVAGDTNPNPTAYRDEIKLITDYYENIVVKKDGNAVYVPYRYIIPFNIVFNWSLQNHSSYYTDIGFFWMSMYIMMILAVIYGIVAKKKKLLALSLATMSGWVLWVIIGGGILWYGIGLLVWGMLTSMAFIYTLYTDLKERDRVWLWLALVFLGFWAVLQIFFNLVRISSQGAGGPFSWYKANTGRQTIINDQLQPETKVAYGYTADDVLKLQFPHYLPFIEQVDATREDKDGVLIAGTYLAYFLENQQYIKYDGLLSKLSYWVSDADPCASYLRLQDQNLKYLVIDPNIGTVVMGGGNETLFHKFFAKMDPVAGTIERHGTISMLALLSSQGYIDLISTNNIGAKYAFTISDDVLKTKIGKPDATDEELVLLRARLSVSRFFRDSNKLIQLMQSIFNDRMQTADAIGDIADIYGQIIDEEKVKAVALKWVQKKDVTKDIKKLTQDERLVLTQFLNAYQMVAAGNSQQYQKFVGGLVQKSLAGSSQVIIFELNNVN